MTPRELLRRLSDAGVVAGLSEDGKILLRLTNGPLPPELAAWLRDNGELVLTWLRRRARAEEIACAAALEAAEVLYDAGAEGGERLQAAGEVLTDAFWYAVDSDDFAALRAAAEDYVELAHQIASEAR